MAAEDRLHARGTVRELPPQVHATTRFDGYQTSNKRSGSEEGRRLLRRQLEDGASPGHGRRLRICVGFQASEAKYWIRGPLGAHAPTRSDGELSERTSQARVQTHSAKSMLCKGEHEDRGRRWHRVFGLPRKRSRRSPPTTTPRAPARGRKGFFLAVSPFTKWISALYTPSQ